MHPLVILRYAQATITDAVKDLPDAEWDTPNVCGVWSVKQIIGHLIGWEHYYVEFLAPFAGETMPTPHMDDYKALDEQAFNDKYGTAASSRTPTDLMAEFQAAYEQSIELAAKIPAETWHQLGTLPWNAEGDLEDFAVYGQYGHKYEHAAQIVVFRDQLKRAKA
ncbi:MAG: DinB family protein [Chloroflexota bacterium]|nr:DinB family protein [Chloroflexota bacterium]